jgi:serine/threonine protein kinase
MAEAIDARSDLYAMGVVLYECLVGALPYAAANPIALIAKVLHGTPVPPHEQHPEVPAALSALVLRLMAKDPGDRPQSARELAAALGQLG